MSEVYRAGQLDLEGNWKETA